MSVAPLFALLDARMAELHEVGVRALEQCRRRGRAQFELIEGGGEVFTDPNWRVSVPGSGYGSGGGLGTRDPTDVPTVPGQSANDPWRNRGGD